MTMSKKDLQQARANLKAHVRNEITKREVLQVRCEPQLMGALLDLAAERKVALSVMLREWIAERLKQETEDRDEDPVLALIEMEVRLRQLRERMKRDAASQQKVGGTKSLRTNGLGRDSAAKTSGAPGKTI